MKTVNRTKRWTLILAVGLILITAAALIVIISLIKKHDKLGAQLETERSETADTVSNLHAELDVFRESETSYRSQLDTFVENETNYQKQLKSLNDDIQGLRSKYEDEYGAYRTFFEMFIQHSNGKTYVPRGMPEDAVKMLERYVQSLATQDKELYLTTMPSEVLDPSLNDDTDEETARYHAEYMINHFDFDSESFKDFGSECRIAAISGFGGHIILIVTNENGEHLILGVGITQDYFTGEWVIYDFD